MVECIFYDECGAVLALAIGECVDGGGEIVLVMNNEKLCETMKIVWIVKYMTSVQIIATTCGGLIVIHSQEIYVVVLRTF